MKYRIQGFIFGLAVIGLGLVVYVHYVHNLTSAVSIEAPTTQPSTSPIEVKIALPVQPARTIHPLTWELKYQAPAPWQVAKQKTTEPTPLEEKEFD
jgi:hypothetical protein